VSISLRDIPAFERYFAQLKTYYFDYKNTLPPSGRQFTLLGLQLLHLLAKNTLDEFHTLLEFIPIDQQSNIFLKHPIQLGKRFYI
jgi:26S proteasome regulatory subunit N12